MINLFLAAEPAQLSGWTKTPQRLTIGPKFLMRCALLSLIAALLACPGQAADPVLAPSGTLRAAYIGPNVAQARLDPATGTVSGMIADIAHELGRRADVPVSITPLPTAAAVLDAVRSGRADIGFVAPNPERTGVVHYSRTYMLVQQSALVRADSPLRSVKELDRPDQVIGVNADDSVGVWLKQRLTTAKVRETPDYTLRDAIQWLRNGDVIAFAGGRQRLSRGTRSVPGLRMLDDNFYGVPQAVAVPLDHQDRLQLVNAALSEMRLSGFLTDSVARSGIDGLTVAPADTQEQ
ncbi:transporter substrate-binding domain-containing protein [Bradyrhizobium sp. RDI18]|uniref:transporter substrate-binding domain-containing protein n=1 Tax=Bradyrhizobium sp. RDI18 TaxID=3367400 RepID=UPI003720170C